MDRASSVVAAFQAGKLPTTEQINSFIDWLNDVGITQVEPEANTELSSRGRVVAGSLRRTLDAYRGLANNKNGDNILQEGLWHLTEGDLTVDSEVDANKDQAKKDIHDLRKALRNLFSVVWDSVSTEGSSIFYDLLSVIRLSLADAAELVEEQAGKAKDSLRSIDDEVQSGQRDTLGRDKQRLEEEKDTKVAWEHGMDTVKGAGSTVIDTTRSATQTAEEKAEKTSQRIQDAWNKISERAQKDEQYRQALDTIFTILQTRLNQTMDAAADPGLTLSNSSTTPPPNSTSPSLHFRTATASVMRDQDLRTWFDDSFAYGRKILAEPGFSDSKASKQQRRELRVRWRTFMEKDDKWKQQIEALKAEWEKIDQGIANDEDVKRIQQSHSNLFSDLEETAKVAGKEAVNKVGEGLQQVGAEVKENQSTIEAAMEQATWFWQDLFKVYIPRAMSKMKDIPIPRTEYKDSELEFVIENLDISFLQLPSLARLHPQHHRHGHPNLLTRPTLPHAPPSVPSPTFAFKLSKSSSTTSLSGIDLDLKVRLIPATTTGANSRENLKHFHVIEKADVVISEDVTIDVRESNHAVIATLFKPMLVARLRDALSRTMSEQLRFVIEWADSVAFDVSKRQQVFEDTGLGGGGSLLAAMWSEIGRLQRESRVERREFGIHPTGTGIIVEQQKVIQGNIETGEDSRVEKAQFAMGAEPQILSGEKRGPLGTGSEPLVKKLKEMGQEVGVDVQNVVGEVSDNMEVDTEAVKDKAVEGYEKAKGAVKEVKDQVETFRASVDRKGQA
ncbi:hypothetical protein BKA70DRAFT_1434941 [Coprinopsis sp. MPI-PUGE-AT-0042]|nr:hypothetical protein BKA70DRAFT_1434941 [Coprinopsis sp. MPI-PUGE-AT-0042]